MNVLEISGLEKRFGEKQVLRGVDLEVPEKKVFGFVGRNGAGKTTTMKITLGLLAADTGTVMVCGEKVSYGNAATNRFIGYLPDVPEFYSFMTPTEYLKFCGEIAGMEGKAITDRAGEMLRLVGLGDEKRRIKGFSRGMKQRLGIAQALMGKPRLLICDEPTSALDPLGRKEILDVLVAAKNETTILFSTHILSDVEHICDEMALVNDGRIVLRGSIEDIRKRRGGNSFVIELEKPADFAGFPQGFDIKEVSPGRLILNKPECVPDVLRFMADKEIAFYKLEKQEPTLEDIFLETIGK